MNEKKARNLCSQYEGFQQHFGGSNWNDTTSRFQSNGLYFLTSIQRDPNVIKKIQHRYPNIKYSPLQDLHNNVVSEMDGRDNLL